ncbi:amino acid adenylation domain-containing protein [Nonomuraea fuscirosea]|uniref:non-ribosomal peptide synthetase n=1 Tax=Nonomuraea fuscirosea TaxID=1291556 RepID=UPI002DD9474C|nr:non-ribosomal peptide synthetase [Nonomuraea fuscirosea]WSA53744.1 amino acid adenylation domain-containing protein [Nonomuraea fuscirosea]
MTHCQESIPASFVQQDMWVGERMGAGLTYHMPLVLWFDGALDVSALLGACAGVVARHPVLATAVAESGDGLRLVPAAEPAVTIAHLPDPAPDALQRLIGQESAREFDLEKGPLARFTLVPAGSGRHLLLFVAHHLVFDGMSKDILVRDLAQLYASGSDGAVEPLPFAWREPEPEVLEAAREFWAGRWTEPAEIVLPGQRRTGRRYGPGAQIDAGLDHELSRSAAKAAAATGASVFEVLLAGVHALLFRHGAENVAVAIDVTTRGPGTRDHIGPFVGELPVLSRPEAGQAFRAFVREMRDELRAVYRFREVPPARVLGQGARGAAVPVSISYRRLEADPVFPGVNVTVDRMMFGGGARNPLHLQILDGPDGLALCVRYDPAAVDGDVAARFADGLRALLRHAADDPDARLGELDVMPPAESRRMLVEWNDTEVAHPAGATLPGLFAEQVRARPDACAVTFGERSLTYAELDAAAARLAARIRRAGVGRGELVAVHLRRSDLLLVCLLAVHKAGAAYLPLDPDHPAERLAMIVADARPALLLSETAVPDGLPGPVLLVDPALPADGAPAASPAPEEPVAGLAPEEPVRPASPEETAYVIYTSGSTGRPKGVEVDHGNLANLLLAMRDRLGSAPGDTWLALTSPAFDISALELYLPLIVAGRVVVAPHDAVRRPEALARLVAAQGVTHVQATPSVWRLLLPGGLAGVTALAGGEALPPQLARELRARCDRVVNVYGPTETTIWSTYGEPGEGDVPITIGRPLANTRIYLLDEAMRPVPIGVPGELCIGGAGVARGYRGRPARTAERFVPDPFGPPGGRLYRTGDLARYRPDGEIEFLGRQDGQVKLLGHRVELGEIETRLREHPQVGETAVVVRGGDTDDHRLIAYVVPAPGRAAPDAGALAAHLARTLPAATVPSAYVVLDALPLNPIGKLDRAALPDPSAATGRSQDQDQDPGLDRGATLVEEVRRIWCEVLELDDVGPDDDLFDLGGHSLTITQISARIRDGIGVDVSLDAFFDDPTITGVVEEIVRLRGAATDEGDTRPAEILPRPDGVDPPLSFVQERLWFLQRFDPDDASYNMYLVLRLRGELDTDALDAALHAVVARHESLRTSFGDVDGEPITVVHPPGPVACERLDLSGSPDPEERALRLVADRTNQPFDLAGTPPLRISLLRLGPLDHVLCFVLHHIIADGSSLGVLFDDLFALYQARTRGEEADLVPLRVQYGDIALWQRERDSGEAAAESLAYWREQLAGPPVLDLPADLPGGERPEGAFHSFPVPAELVSRLERLAQEHNASLFMVLVAAYQVLLARHTGQDDILVGTPWATRDRTELEPVIGYLTDTLVLRGDLAGDPVFSDLLDATRRTVLDAHAHRTVPFERLIGELGVPRDLHRNPLLATMIILHSQAGEGTPPERVGDLGVELFDGGYRQAKFDLSLETWRNEQGLLAVLGYDATRYRAATVQGLAARFEVLLQGIADAPGTPISRLPMLTDADAAVLSNSGAGVPAGSGTEVLAGSGAAVLGASAQGDVDARRGVAETVPALIERAVAATPDATALLWDGETMSYARLDARVARLAADLRRRGVAGGCVVGVCLRRSAEAVVALLAVWRAGGAYLPLDPDYPDERLAFLIADSTARLVVTDAGLAPRLPAEKVVLVSAGEPGAAGEPGPGDEPGSADEPGPGDDRWAGGRQPVQPDDPAYVIYTSGSTGRPKGVLVEHGSLAGRVRWMREAYGIGPDDRVAQFASLSFDAHAEELYPALTAGAGVLLLPDGAASLPDVLRTAAGGRVTVLDLPTAYWHRLTEALDDVTWPQPLRLVILGGEQAHAAAVARWRDRFGDRVRLVNTYGPTEATVIATATDLGEADTAGRPPIGRPIGGTTAHVLGPYGEPVPPGFPGELCLGGEGLARGYPGHPGLTADRFVPDPYGLPGSRLYRTGDRVRRRPDGTLEFLGRFDAQVKVRGFRVEPGEVETALLAHPGVRQAVVTADGERLAAYVVGPAGPDELRTCLAATLPAHLVPTAWVSLAALPLTITGKVDVAALPVPGPGPVAEFVPPRTDAEALVAGIWGELLGVEAVGVDDDFFALGGHSLLATRVAALLRNALDTEVPIRTVFDQPTVAGLAAAVERLVIEELASLTDAEAADLLEVGE